MPEERKVTVSASWDNELVPAERVSKRNLLLEIKAPPGPEQEKERPPLNLALVIDRSGSMGGYRIEAARQAAAGVIDVLGEQDRLSLVIFDSAVETLLSGRAMNAAGKRDAQYLVGKVRSRGATDLAGGWFRGARCVAELLDSGEFTEGNVLVLSDGYANQGVQDPNELMQHAGELADRGVKTSAVGIGANYSPLQLDALAEGGRGRLHDAETAGDIVDVVLGELGELQAITARDVQLKLEYAPMCRLDLLTRSSIGQAGNTYKVRLGDIVGDASRPVGVRVELPALALGERLPFKVSVSWRGSDADSARRSTELETRLYVVPPHEADAQVANSYVIERIADLWEATLAYRAMQFNERH